MEKKILPSILGGLIGLIIGVLGGGFIGLIIGGTFLGGFDIYKNTGIEGYELTAYLGAIIGGVFVTFWGVKYALRKVDKNK
ncbi:MAG: hypothetical protein ACLFPS_01040 [Clostridia bacterium]